MAEPAIPLMERLDAKLRAAFDPASLEIINESHLHAGHQPGFDGTGESHLRIRIRAAAFDGMSRVQAHGAIYTLCKEEFERGLHALAIDARGVG